MRILGIETSCDETSVAIVDTGVEVLSNVISSQQKDFAEKGGVIPEDAARKQVEYMLPVLQKALDDAVCDMSSIDTIAVTCQPGLLGSLLVGTMAARVCASVHKKPLIGVHHTLGHLSSIWLEAEQEPQFPCLTLSASGGHTELWHRTSHTEGTLLGQTRDDAAGEAFDKGAAMLGLPYPGGPAISKRADNGDKSTFTFPKPLQGDDSYDWSFSGLKTALKYTIRDLDTELNDQITNDLSAGFQHAICDHLVSRIARAVENHPDVEEIHIVGGVSANRYLRTLIQEQCPDRTIRWPVKIPYCTDNAAMIAAAGYFMVQEKGDVAFERFETKASGSVTTVLSQ